MEDINNQSKQEFTEQDREFLQKIDKRLGRIERRFAWSAFFSFLNALIIIGPIVIGVIYLSPILKMYIDKIGPLVQALPSFNAENQNTAVNNYDFLPPQIKTMICNKQVREEFVKQNCPGN